MNTAEKAKDAYIKKRFPEIFEQEKVRLSSFFSEKQLTEKINIDIQNEWTTIQNTMNQAVTYFYEEMESTFPTDVLKAMNVELRSLDHQLSRLEKLPNLKDLKLNPSSSAFLNAIYQMAKKWLKEKHFGKSASLFYLLASLAPQVFDCWIGLGMSRQGNGELHEALQAYTVAWRLMEGKHPLPMMYMAECYQTAQKNLGKSTQTHRQAGHVNRAVELTIRVPESRRQDSRTCCRRSRFGGL